MWRNQSSEFKRTLKDSGASVFHFLSFYLVTFYLYHCGPAETVSMTIGSQLELPLLGPTKTPPLPTKGSPGFSTFALFLTLKRERVGGRESAHP